MTSIVTYVHRPKRPRKRKAVALAGPAIVRKVQGAEAPTEGKPEPAAPPPPANDDSQPPRPTARKSAIVTTTSRKLVKLRRAEKRAAEPDDDPEATARVKAFFARMIRPPQ